MQEKHDPNSDHLSDEGSEYTFLVLVVAPYVLDAQTRLYKKPKKYQSLHPAQPSTCIKCVTDFVMA